MLEDRQLWERMCQKDEQAFDEFYRENSTRLEAFLRHLLGNRQAAQDVMQDTFTQIWRRPNGFQPERGTLRTYLYAIARKRALDWWRTHGAKYAGTDPISTVCLTESDSIISDAFRRLPEDQRALLWLREVEGHSYSELAETLGIPVGTVKSRLFVAREALRKIWHAPRRDKDDV